MFSNHEERGPIGAGANKTKYELLSSEQPRRLALFHYTLCDTFWLIAQSIKLLAIALWLAGRLGTIGRAGAVTGGTLSVTVENCTAGLSLLFFP